MERLLPSILGFVASLVLASAVAMDVPKLKPGLWEMQVSFSAVGTSSDIPPTVCIGSMTAAQRASEEEQIKARCSKYEAKLVGADWVVDATCTARGNTLTKPTITRRDGERYHEENKSLQGSMTSDGKWVGPCKAGQVPGIFK